VRREDLHTFEFTRARIARQTIGSGEALVNDGYILLIEDRGEDIELTLRAFEKTGITNRIEVVHDGLEALAFLEGAHPFAERSRGQGPAMVLLDVNLPRMNGIQLLQKIRHMERLRYVPIIMITSSNEERDLKAAYDAGANSYIRKPVSSTDFGALIYRLCAYWLQANEPPPTFGRI
jgi:two-component system response regulator